MNSSFKQMLLLIFFISLNANALSDRAQSKENLRLIGYQNFATGEKFGETELGGLSGIVYDKIQKKLLAISDDRGYVNDARFYEFNLILNEKIFSVAPISVTTLKSKEGLVFKKGYPDFEGITLLGDNILVSSEGGIDRKIPTNPELFVFNRKGEFVEQYPVPEKFLPPIKANQDKPKGARDNQVFEALSTSLDGKIVMMGTEEALFQDGPISNVNYSSPVRIIVYKEKKVASELAYKLEKVEALKAIDLSPGVTGLTDLAVIDERNFYSLERTYLPFLNKNVIRIFKCKVTDQTTNISSMDSLKDMNYVSVEKELVADLDDYLTAMTPPTLDNIEGLAFGPILSNGNQTLLVVSDNNFGKNQRTLFMAFEIKNQKK